MAGKIRRLLDTIIAERSKGNPALVNTTRTKLMLKGINPDQYDATSPDDQAIIEKIKKIALEMKLPVSLD